MSSESWHKTLGSFGGLFSGVSGGFAIGVETGRLQRFAEVRQAFLRLIRADRLLRPPFLIFTTEGKRGRYPHFQAGINISYHLGRLLILYNVRSERELMVTIPERMDWMWFRGYDLDDKIPNHSVLSKARARWGGKAFGRFFERVVGQWVEAGLVDRSKLFVDASLIQAGASNNSVVDRQKLQKDLHRGY